MLSWYFDGGNAAFRNVRKAGVPFGGGSQALVEERAEDAVLEPGMFCIYAGSSGFYPMGYFPGKGYYPTIPGADFPHPGSVYLRRFGADPSG